MSDEPMPCDVPDTERPGPYSKELRAAIDAVDLAALRLQAAMADAEVQMRSAMCAALLLRHRAHADILERQGGQR